MLKVPFLTTEYQSLVFLRDYFIEHGLLKHKKSRSDLE